MEVFPTPWSPRNTSLYFARGAMLGAALPSEEAIWRARDHSRCEAKSMPPPSAGSKGAAAGPSSMEPAERAAKL